MNKKFKKKVAIFSAAISLCSFFTPLNEAKSDEIDTVTRNFSYAVAQDSSDPSQLNLYKVSAAGAATLIEANLFPDGGPGTFSASDMAVDNVLGKIKKANKLLKGSGRMLVRKSGTEPVIRIMCESENHAILSKCVNIVKNSIN